MAGIDSIVNTRADAFTNNPQALMQRYAMGQDLLDLLALQKLKQDKEAAARSLQMNMQTPQGTIKDQLNSQVMDMTKQEVASSLAPGIQQQGQRMAAQQVQNMMGAGLPTQPAPALVGMAGGGIVGYANGDLVEEEPTTPFGRRRAARAVATQRGRDELALNEELYKTYAPSAGFFGYFKEQTDEERARAKGIMDLLPSLSYADKLALAATGELPNEANIRLALDEGGYRTPSRLLPLPQENYSPVAAPTTATTQATPAAPAAPTAPVPSGYEEQLSSLLESISAESQPAATQPAERPQFRSRYEDRLADIQAEKQDKLGALIEFLQAAGASGGTNLGATLMGGGSGLRARDERLRQQETEALQGAIADENAYLQRMFNEEQLRQQSESARLDRESRENIAREDRAARLDEANATAAANIQKAIFEANQNANEADIEVNTYAHEAVLADQEFILAKQAILDKYASSMFSSGNPQQAAAEISALYRKMFNQVKNYITNPGSGAAGRFPASYQ